MEFWLAALILTALIFLFVGWRLGRRESKKISFEKLLQIERDGKALSEAGEAKYRTILESIHSGFSLNEIIFDHAGNPVDIRLLYANKRFLDLHGLKEKSTLQKPYSEIFPDFDKDLAAKAYSVTSTGKSYTRIVLTFVNKYVESILYKAEDHQFIRFDSDLTERMAVETELLASQQKFQGIYNLIPDIAGIISTSEARFVECNPAFTKITGYTVDEYSGKSPFELGLLESSNLIRDLIKDLGKEDSFRDFEPTLITKKGTRITCLVSAQKINYYNNPCFLFVAHDITQRKKAEEALEKRLLNLTQPKDNKADIGFDDLFNIKEIQQIQDIFAQANGVASIITDPDGTPLTRPSNFCRFCQIIRHTKKGSFNCRLSDETLGKFNLTSPTIQPCLSGGLWDAAACISAEGKHIATWLIGQVRNEKQDIEYMRKYAHEIEADENQFIEAFKEVPEMSEEQFQKIAAALFSMTQLLSRQAYQNIQQARVIAELKKTQNELVFSERNFFDIYNMSPVIIGISRRSDGVFLDINQAFYNISGYTREEFIGKTSSELGIWTFTEERDRMLYNLDQKGEVSGFETTLTTKSGLQLTCLFSARKIRFHNEDCLLFLVNDITERKMIEEQITALNANLEKKIAERTSQLRQVVRDHEAFAYGISHDLRSPLRHIDGFLRLMITKLNTQDPVVKDYFEKIYLASNRMSSMIDDLLTYSRLGRKELDQKPVDLNVLVNDIIEQQKVINHPREIEWEVNLLPTILCDQNLFKTVFENLISNAVKYTSPKQLAVIEIGARDLPGKLVEVYIKDNGVGFNMAYANRLFGVFQRLHHNEEFAGTGIGLANVKQIVSRHNGTVRAEGKINEGATFYITIPM